MGIQTLLLIKDQLQQEIKLQQQYQNKLSIKLASTYVNQDLSQQTISEQSQSVQAQTNAEYEQTRQDEAFNLINNFSAINLEYKIANEDIVSYASSLQQNQLSKYIQYQPASYANVWVTQQIQQITKTITYDPNIQVSKKCSMMNGFIVSTMQQFTTKEAELTRILSFKTKFINKFIQKMKSWREKYDIKNKYGDNIRHLYFQETKSIFKLLNISKQGVPLCKICRNNNFHWLECISELQKRISINNNLMNVLIC